MVAEAIARAAKRLNDLREAWLNPPDRVERVPEVVPLGMVTSPHPDRVLPKHGQEKDLADRTLTKLYNARPAWLDAAHKTLDVAVAAAYGWANYSVDMADDELLKRLLALNLARAAQQRPECSPAHIQTGFTGARCAKRRRWHFGFGTSTPLGRLTPCSTNSPNFKAATSAPPTVTSER